MMKFFKLKMLPGALILAGSCILWGCGSDNGSGISASRKDQKPPEKQKGVIELLVDKPGGQGVGKKAPGGIPPEVPGIPQNELEASIKAYKEIDRDSLEIIPPSKPGERGLTRREVEALRPKKVEVDPQSVLIIPPSKPGERGLTRGEVEALRPKQAQIDPESVVIIPPSKPGERGTTLREINEIRASQKKSSGGAPELTPSPSTPKSP